MNKKVLAWSLYDFANTAFSALYITFFFPILIKTYLGGNEFQIGLVMSLSFLTAALIVPFLGAMADATGRKLPIIFMATIFNVGLTAITPYAQLQWALIFGFLANLFYLLGLSVYNAQLVDIAGEKERGRVSGLGVAVGYLGTIASLAIAYPFLGNIKAIFLVTAIFFFIFSLPLFLFLRDKKIEGLNWISNFKKAFLEVKKTVTYLLPGLPGATTLLSSTESSKAGKVVAPGLGSFLVGSFFYNNAMNTIIIFLSLFATTVIGLSVREFFFVFALLAIGSFFGAMVAGYFSDKIGPVKMLTAALVVWMAVTAFFILFQQSLMSFLLAGMVGGGALGAVWTGNRHLVTKLAPSHKVAEIFGFEGLTERFSGVIGPLLFGYLVTVFGNYSYGLVSLLIFFVIGLVFLNRVPRT